MRTKDSSNMKHQKHVLFYASWQRDNQTSPLTIKCRSVFSGAEVYRSRSAQSGVPLSHKLSPLWPWWTSCAALLNDSLIWLARPLLAGLITIFYNNTNCRSNKYRIASALAYRIITRPHAARWREWRVFISCPIRSITEDEMITRGDPCTFTAISACGLAFPPRVWSQSFSRN